MNSIGDLISWLLEEVKVNNEVRNLDSSQHKDRLSFLDSPRVVRRGLFSYWVVCQLLGAVGIFLIFALN